MTWLSAFLYSSMCMSSLWYDFGSVFLKGEAVPFIVYPTTAPYIRLWLCLVLQVRSIQMNGSVLLFQAQPQLNVSIEGDAAFAKTLQPLYGIGNRSTSNQILMAYPNYRPSILKVRENPFRSVYMEWLQTSKSDGLIEGTATFWTGQLKITQCISAVAMLVGDGATARWLGLHTISVTL